MHGVEIAESDHKLVLILDKDVLPMEEITRTRSRYEELDIPPVPYASDEEQAELEAILNSLTDEDREIVYTHRVDFGG